MSCKLKIEGMYTNVHRGNIRLIFSEPKTLVTVGSSSLDTDNLDEINLNTSNESNQSSDSADPNANILLEQSNQVANSDSILSQAASSLSALPSVASNVFSTFSKRITGISSRESTPTYDQQDANANTLAFQSDIQQSHQGDLSQAPPTFYAPPLSTTYISSHENENINLPSSEPPKFYIPSDVPPVPSTAPPLSLGGQNNFRFSSKKKLYAPIPGLSDQSQQPTTTLDSSTVRAPLSCDTFYASPSSGQFSEQNLEDRKQIGGGLFSKISSLAPTGVLQNITGLVQSAAESLTQSNKSDSYQEPPLPIVEHQNNYFATPSLPTNYFIPPPIIGVAEGTDTGTHICAPDSQTFLFSGQQLHQGINETFQPLKETEIPLFTSAGLQAIPQTPLLNSQSSNINSAGLPPTEQPVATLFNANQFNPLESPLSTAEQIALVDTSKYLPQSSQSLITSLSSPPPTSGHTSYRLQKGTKLYKNPLTPQETAHLQIKSNPITPLEAFGKTYSSQENFNTPSLFISSPIEQQNIIPSTAGIEPPPAFIVESISPQPAQNIPLFAPHLSTSPTEGQSVIPSAPVIGPPPAFIAESIPKQSTQNASFFVPAEEKFKTGGTPQATSSLFAAPLPSNNFIGESPSSTQLENHLSNETTQSIPLFASSFNPLVPELKTEEDNNITFVPPLKKLKSEESVQDSPKFITLNQDSSLNENKTEEIEQSLNVDLSSNTLLTHVPKQNNKEIAILESIETASTELRKGLVEDPLEETLKKLSLSESSSQTNSVKLPPIAESFNLNDPRIRGYTKEPEQSAALLPTLANFFTPESSVASAGLNFFTELPSAQQTHANDINYFSETVQNIDNKEKPQPIDVAQGTASDFFAPTFTPALQPLQPDTAVHPPISAFFPKFPTTTVSDDKSAASNPISESFVQENVTPPNRELPPNTIEPTVHQINTTVLQETKSETQQPEIVNRFSNYFNQSTSKQSETCKDSSTFFDSFPGQRLTQAQLYPQEQQQIEVTTASVGTNEEQRIQYFFNNPPPQEASAIGDLNYDLVHSGLAIKHLEQRSLTPISNLVEPPSSACSEFSERSNSTAGQRSIAANLSLTETSEKQKIEEQEVNKSIIEEPDSLTEICGCTNLPEEIVKELRMANLVSADKTATKPTPYTPAVKHWFFKSTIGDKHVWVPFSHYDSALLETSLLMEGDDKSNIVAVEGGRYDVNISERKKMSVYWDGPPIEVRRCSWFYKGLDSKHVPYEESTADLLESEYQKAAETASWHHTVALGMGEQVEFHSPTVIVHFQQQQNTDAWGGTSQTSTRPRVVRRDLDDFNIEQGESQKVDHLLFMVHGIGSACDLKLRTVEEVVEDFRTIARQLVQSHYKNSTDMGLVGRVEVLPISWHSHLHSVEMGIDEKLRMITLESIPKLRNFTNDTLLDILFYTSPTFCQKIMNTITSSMNTLYLKYRERHPEFNGGVSLSGHSLGSLILFDLLCHQNPIKESEETNLKDFNNSSMSNQTDIQMDSNQVEDTQISYTMGPAGTGQPFINYPQLIFQPKKFFALGSPIGMFVTIRGIDKLGLDFRLPTCPGFYNIFHPYDPVAYRIEALVNPDLSGIRPVLIPHHKGRKRMHLELKETMTRVSMDLKTRFLDKFKMTLDSVNIFGSASKSTKEAEELMEKEVDKVIQMQIQLEQQHHNNKSNEQLPSGSNAHPAPTARPRTDSVSTAMSDDIVEIDFPLGKLNDSKRIDYVLQEAPLEFINEYIFALSSHVCYWDSEDTILFVMKEIYTGLGISPDSQVPQQTMTIERPSSRNSLLYSS